VSSQITPRGSDPQVFGREEGPLRAFCEVLGAKRVGSYWSLTFVAPAIAERARPGQFVTLAVDVGGATLRRPFSIASVSQQGPWAGTIEIVFSGVGQGTHWLAQRGKHDVLDLVGPLGRGFPLPNRQVPALLVGGGYGAAPMLYLARTLGARGHRVDVVLGARTAEQIYNTIEAKRAAASATFTTDDGSLGTQGIVTDVLDGVAEHGRSEVVYGCGPMPMLAGVARWAADRGLPSQVAVEEAMACGTGVCMTCVVPVRRKGQRRNVRACVEGPVLNGARVDWDAVRSPAMAQHELDEETG